MKLIERFLKYVSYPTMSDENSDTCPSSKKQLALAKVLKAELEELGLKARLDKYGYVYGELPANTDEPMARVGFIAHMDTSDAVSDTGIKPRELLYEGGDIVLNEYGEKPLLMKVADYPYLADFAGKHLIVTDGTTLLGGDDKAGVAEIITALDELIKSGEKHGKIAVCFTPDEEIGRGADHFDVEAFGVDYAYTSDGGRLGELEYENFNAASAKIVVRGISIHPGSAKNKMVNAAAIACELHSLLPKRQVPEKTEGYQGFFHLTGMKGETELAELAYIIRDHDRQKFEDKKRLMKELVRKLNRKYGKGTLKLTLKDSYYNMKDVLADKMFVVEKAMAAMRECGVEPVCVPIRGGTDGARISYMGLPCPNLCTGGENYHSRFEFVCVEDMATCVRILKKLMIAK
ncbi:MAG: peptidase T [Clostridia bacterium]|nr:peptidase T [Clostridia bacterium]